MTDGIGLLATELCSPCKTLLLTMTQGDLSCFHTVDETASCILSRDVKQPWAPSFGARSFSVAAAKIWNSLFPVSVPVPTLFVVISRLTISSRPSSPLAHHIQLLLTTLRVYKLYLLTHLLIYLAPSRIDHQWYLQNGWMDQDKTSHEGRPRPRPQCVRWGNQPPPPQKRGTVPPNFGPMSIVAKRLDVSWCNLVRR